MLDLHLPVVAGEARPEGGLRVAKPIVYGTAFPILPGLFITAAHVVRDARVDGQPALAWMNSQGDVKAFEIVDCELFPQLDLALCHCPGLADLVPIVLDFENQLELLMPAYAIGFPHAIDPEWVTMAPRGFRGHVVTRREMYHLPAQPAGYELSFGAPQGLSGAPVVSHVHGDHRCYGYVIQQGSVGVGNQQTVVGVAVDIGELLSVQTMVMGLGPVALAFGRKPVTPRPPTPPRLPGGLRPATNHSEGWPDE